MKHLLLLIPLLLLSAGCSIFETSANVRQMHENEMTAFAAYERERDDYDDAVEADLADAHAFQGEMAFRFRTLAGMVDDKITRAKLEAELKSWAEYRARKKLDRQRLRLKRDGLAVNAATFRRAHRSTSRWLNKRGVSRETQEQIDGDARAIADRIASRRRAKAVEKAAERAALEAKLKKEN